MLFAARLFLFMLLLTIAGESFATSSTSSHFNSAGCNDSACMSAAPLTQATDSILDQISHTHDSRSACTDVDHCFFTHLAVLKSHFLQTQNADAKLLFDLQDDVAPEAPSVFGLLRPPKV